MKTKRSFIFSETYIVYITSIPITLCGAKCAEQLSYGFIILKKLEDCTHEYQNPYLVKGLLLYSVPKPHQVSTACTVPKPPKAGLTRSVPKLS